MIFEGFTLERMELPEATLGVRRWHGITSAVATRASSFMAMGDGTHKLSIKADLRRAIGKDSGNSIAVCLNERIG